MRKIAVIMIVVGTLLFLSVFLDLSLSFWRILELIISIILIASGIGLIKPSININGKVIDGSDQNEIHYANEQLNYAEEEIESEKDMPEFARKIAKGSIHVARNSFIKRKDIKKIVRRTLFGLTSGVILFLDSLSLFGLNFNFWEFLLVLIGSFLLTSGISSLIPDRRRKN
ncbi:hypothetical protein [Geotoga petraea]|jgi:hypothetical protein|uniref:Uncharacterized protein n=1 Tax=Geotoga petraea TaxID=28234 RepID=A0A1G6IC34_9BACT|nr:hypothetical protein [Geotoga petraea]MDK2945607.1 hypothetical protein [Geotoga sp.]TGG89160.1 hypothetical protein E4650_02915 [Geotoga petraea]SDC04018.1 hypothetical protein SAMN04488588_0324 [Geotoga petraea]